MCNDYEQRVAWADYRKAMQQLELGIPTEQSEADLPQADDIRVNEVGPVMRVAGNGVELLPMTFGFPPKGLRGGLSSTSNPRAVGSTRATAALYLRRHSSSSPASAIQRPSTASP